MSALFPQGDRVIRHHTDTSSHIEPPLDQAWDDGTKLRWHAAVAKVDAGLTIRIHGHHDRFLLQVGRTSVGGPMSFHEAWRYMSAAMTGAQEALRSEP